MQNLCTSTMPRRKGIKISFVWQSMFRPARLGNHRYLIDGRRSLEGLFDTPHHFESLPSLSPLAVSPRVGSFRDIDRGGPHSRNPHHLVFFVRCPLHCLHAYFQTAPGRIPVSLILRDNPPPNFKAHMVQELVLCDGGTQALRSAGKVRQPQYFFILDIQKGFKIFR